MTDTTAIDFFFDCSSPWTYLAFHNIQPLATELGVPIRWKPMLVGGVFNAINPSVYAMRENPVPAKWNYMHKDMQDWARMAGLTLVFPPRVFPVNSVKTMRGCLWLLAQDRLATADEPQYFLPFTTAVFEAYWAQQADISQDSVLTAICEQSGIDPQAFFEGIAQPIIKEQLKANTEEIIRRGGFGSPTLYVGEDMYFGNDRLCLVKNAILQKKNPPKRVS